MTPTPTLRALVLADNIYTDVVTGKRVIAGTFNKIGANNLPRLFGRTTWAFILISDCIGEGEMRLRFVDLKDNHVLLQSPVFTIRSEDRFATIDIAIEIPNLPLREAGFYSFECYIDEEMIGSVRLEVIKVEPEGEEIDYGDD